ncbi:MAG: hypothetical protein AAFQ81_11770, partial [Pseudomonadota bacterium]
MTGWVNSGTRDVSLGLVALAFLAGCQTTSQQGNVAVTSQPETIRICDASGCFDAPSDYASYDPS